jgi:hypothetical protein
MILTQDITFPENCSFFRFLKPVPTKRQLPPQKIFWPLFCHFLAKSATNFYYYIFFFGGGASFKLFSRKFDHLATVKGTLVHRRYISS